MTAFQPWGGAFGSLAMLWATAHTTQFTTPGAFSYLFNGTGPGTGSGLLARGGSYVTLEDFSTGDFTIVVEKMSLDHSPCCRPSLANFSVAAENATFTLVGAPARAASLFLWRTHWSFGAPGDATSEFERQPALPVVGGRVTLLVEPDSVYTLTTLPGGEKGSFPPPPPPAGFPAAFADDFEASDQNGVFECQPRDAADPAHGVVMRQMVPLVPIAWGGDTRPHTLIGSRDLVNTSFSIDVRLMGANGSVTLGARLGALWESADRTLPQRCNGPTQKTQGAAATRMTQQAQAIRSQQPLGRCSRHCAYVHSAAAARNCVISHAPPPSAR
jgi:galactosylceramidase